MLSHGSRIVSDVLFWSVMTALSKPVSSSPCTKFIDNLTSERNRYLNPDRLERLHFLDSDSILVRAATNRCTSLSDPPLFTPVMCVNTADRLPRCREYRVCRSAAATQGKNQGVGGCLKEHLSNRKARHAHQKSPFISRRLVRACHSVCDLTLVRSMLRAHSRHHWKLAPITPIWSVCQKCK